MDIEEKCQSVKQEVQWTGQEREIKVSRQKATGREQKQRAKWTVGGRKREAKSQ